VAVCHNGCNRMVVGFTTTCAISAYHHWCSEFESCSWRGVLDTTLCDKVCQCLAPCRWFSPGTTISTQEYLKKNEKKLAQSFNFTFHCMDDVFLLNNSV
jgi:hypothetical protein